jgi:hypothetical protein
MHSWRITAGEFDPEEIARWRSPVEALEAAGFTVGEGIAYPSPSVRTYYVQHTSKHAMTMFALAVHHGIRPFEYTEVL